MVLKSLMEFVLLFLWPLSPMFLISGLMCWAENWWRKLSQKIVEKIHTCLHFYIKNSPNYDKLHKVRRAMDCLNKKLCQILSVTDLPQTNRFVQNMSDIILKYTWRISLTSLCLNCCAVLWYGLWSRDLNLQWTEWSQILENWGAWYGTSCSFVIWLYSDIAKPEN
jgi:hypothetical protein